jgi:hypothetical protein
MNKQEQIALRRATGILSRLYRILCACRREFPELAQLLDPDFHLGECDYRKVVAPFNLSFEKGASWVNS